MNDKCNLASCRYNHNGICQNDEKRKECVEVSKAVLCFMGENKNLLPCPFCGGEVSIAEMGDGEANWYGITRGTGENPCKCRIFMESEPFFDDDSQVIKDRTKKSLIEAWNRRTCSL